MVRLVSREIINNYAIPSPERAFLNELLNYFRTLVPKRLGDARIALDENNYKNLRFLLHALKNSFLNVGSLIVAEECQQLEDDLENLSAAEISSQLEYLQKRYAEVHEEFSFLIENEY